MIISRVPSKVVGLSGPKGSRLRIIVVMGKRPFWAVRALLRIGPKISVMRLFSRKFRVIIAFQTT